MSYYFFPQSIYLFYENNWNRDPYHFEQSYGYMTHPDHINTFCTKKN